MPIWDLCIQTQTQRKGSQRNIIEALKEWCQSQNITELRLDVYNDNPSAIRAEKVGFKTLSEYES
jgi:ribosomal protein S18 acetylase RimI-like enzyme